MNKKIIIVVIVLVVSLGGYFVVKNLYPAPSIPQTLNQSIEKQPSNLEEPVVTQPATIEKSEKLQEPQAIVVIPKTYNISIKNFAFGQKTVSIKKGDTIIWTNNDSASHTVTGKNGGPASGNLKKDQTYSFTFNTVGTFDYYCAIHPSMTGNVVVTQ